MINPTHPDTPHISAVRAWRFAQELARLGHRVVLLTATRNNAIPTLEVDPHYDWRQPCVLACAAVPHATSPGPRWLRPVHRARTALHMLKYGGEAKDWLRAAVRAGSNLPEECRPDVVWCTFGKMEAVFAARRIARALRVPWVLDVKDNWELYVPRGLRQLMVWRTRGFAAVTSNARFTQRMTQRWQRANARVIYSGVEDCFLARDRCKPAGRFEINLVGGVYFADALRTLLTGIAAWYRTLADAQRAQVRFRYLGAQGELVQRMAAEAVPGLVPELCGYVSAETMARLCRCAAVNTYTAHPGAFHHKLLELLACGRPVLACPSETEESRQLAAPAAGQLRIAATAADVAAVLRELSVSFFTRGEALAPYPEGHVARYGWPAQAQLLQQVLLVAASSGRPVTRQYAAGL